MRELIKSRLKRIEDLEDRALLKQILNGVFIGLVDYTDDQLNEVRDQVFSEIEDDASQFDVYYNILSKDDIDPISQFFFPMEPLDVKEEEQMDLLTERLTSEAGAYMTKVYLDCDYLELHQFVNSNRERTFSGSVETTKNSYPIQFQVQFFEGYLEKVAALYRDFIGNGIPWRTVLHPHIAKFLSLHIAEPLELEKYETVKKISFDLEEMRPYQRVDYVPMWNIRQLEIPNESFPVPAEDHINYQHVVNIEKFGVQNGYLVETDSVNIQYVSKTAVAIKIISENEKVLKWHVLQIVQPDDSMSYSTLQSNHKNDFYTDRFARRENFTIRSMCEISRIINGFDLMKKYSLEDIEIVDSLPKLVETYNVNVFVEDNLRKELQRKVMKLSFTAQTITTITRDEISFLVSEIQMRFPEFYCIGVLL